MFQPLATAAKNFGHQSGDYNVELVIGDAVLSNSFQWNLGTVNLKFPEPTAAEHAEKSSVFKDKQNMYQPKPEIKVKMKIFIISRKQGANDR